MDTILFNRYQIIRPLGSGGFGDTYIATDLHSPKRKKVVVKSLKPIHYETNTEVVEKLFLKEASVLEDLGANYQQIPTLNAFFSLDNQYYLVQEYIEGKSLKEFGIISPEQCFQILSSLLETLKYIHSQNIIHRDIKPENIIIRECKDKPESLIPVLIDFGAVKETMGAINLSDGSVVSSVIVGTMGFMPLEQGMGKTVFSSDLYSLALTMIYSLTGKYPIAFPTNPLNGEIEWDSVTTNIPEHLKMILQKATKIDTLQRYSTAEEMYHALHQHQTPEDSLSPTLVVSPAHPKKTNTPQTNLSEEFPTLVVNKSGKNKTNSFVPTESLSNNDQSENKDNNENKNNPFFILALFLIVIILGVLGGFFITQMGNIFFGSTPNNGNGNTNVTNNNIFPQEAIETVEKLYVLVSEKEFDQAYHLYSPEMQSGFTGAFFEQFERVTVEDLSVTSQTPTSIDLIGYNTYFYPDGSTQREERSYRLEKLNGSPIIVSSEFIRVTKHR